MPNYCVNELHMNGSVADVDQVRALMGDAFDFNQILPEPQPTEKEIERDAESGFKILSDTRHSWRLAHWGTKWNASDVMWVRGPEVVFQTAWSPALPVARALAARFPRVQFCLEYFERGAAVCGGLRCGHTDEYGDVDPEQEWSGKYYGLKGG